MHWYDGTIAEAVTLSKQRNAIFVVFIEGDNDLSREMAATIDDSNVLKRLADQQNFLAIKLMSGSPNYTHFAQIYQFVPVPSLFFIGRNGTPLEVVCAGVQPSNLATRIDRILEEHHKPIAQPSSSSQNLKQQTADLLTAEAGAAQTSKPETSKPETSKPETSKPDQEPQSDTQMAQPETSSEPPKKQQKTQHVEITKSGKEYDVVCSGDVCTRVLRVGPADPGPSTANVIIKDTQRPTEEPTPSVAQPTKPTEETPSKDEKVEKAKELIEARRREKLAKEKELEIQKELERRALGHGVTELKQWQADQELKTLQEERKREKMENNLARQRILEQIAQDRAERKARDQPQVVQPVLVQQQPTVSSPPPTAGDGGTRCRIQFKLPDGTSHTAHFDSSGTLGDVQTYVADNLQLSRSNFSLWTAFPRQELTEHDATLRNLQLTPSAALLVLPRRATNNTVASPATLSNIIENLPLTEYDATLGNLELTPSAARLVPPRRATNTVASSAILSNIIAVITQIFTQFILEPSQQLYAWILSRFNPDRPTTTRPPTESTPPPNTRTTPPAVRRRGNIHRLGEERTDDDNNTWNGNSTQQM